MLLLGSGNALIDRLASSETFGFTVPVGNGRLAKLPAEQHNFTFHFAGEIQQADVEIFNLNSGSVDFADGILDPLNGFFPLGLAAGEMTYIQK
jgi:hypothetical protein